jgi:hypothetical protein
MNTYVYKINAARPVKTRLNKQPPLHKPALPRAGEFLSAHDIKASGFFQVKGNTLFGEFYSVTPNILESLGINPSLHKPGCIVILMDEANFRRCAEADNSEGAMAIYPVVLDGKINELPQVLKGERAFLSDEARIIALPKNAPWVSFAHEVMHDIYFGGGIRLGKRNDFINEIIRLYRDTINPSRILNETLHYFFQQIARRCEDSDVLSRISPNYLDKKSLANPHVQAFVAECFAYAFEIILDSGEAGIKIVPLEILQKMEELGIFPELKPLQATIAA